MSMLSRLTFSTLFFATIAMAALPMLTEAATYYVAPTGSDSNPGTLASPWRTLTASTRKLACGDTLYVRGGTYTTETTILFNQFCADNNRINVLNYLAESPIVSWPNRQSTSYLMYFYKTPLQASNVVGGITVQGIELYNGYLGVKYDNAERIILRDMIIHHEGEGAILGTCKNCTLDRSRIYDNGDYTLPQCGSNPLCNQFHGLYISGTGWTITNNLIYDNLGYGIQAHGKTSSQCSTAPDNTYCAWSGLIANNTFAYQRNRSGIILWNENPVQQAATIANNLFYENSQSQSTAAESAVSISANSVSGTIIRNNVHFATAPGGTLFLGGRGSACTGCTMSGNTVNTLNPSMTNAPESLPATPDFHLTASSTVAIDKGLDGPAYTNVDHDKRARPAGAGHDAGAYEFSSEIASLKPPQNLRVH